MHKAMMEDRTIITFDRDYGELIFKKNYKPRGGVIYLRLENYTPLDPGYLVENLILSSNYNFENALTVIDGNSLRQRKY